MKVGRWEHKDTGQFFKKAQGDDFLNIEKCKTWMSLKNRKKKVHNIIVGGARRPSFKESKTNQ